MAEARILVRPDTSRFRTDLEAQLKSVLARPVKIPVVPVVGPGFGAAAAGTAAFTAAQQSAAAATAVTADALATATAIQRQYSGAVVLSTASVDSLAAAQLAEAAAAKASAAAAAAQVRTLSGVAKGAAASGLTMFGLRGATLAASGAFLAGTAAVVGFSKSLQSAASLETELNVFRIAAGATADEMARVSEEVKKLGKDLTLPGVTANDAAVALTELSKAGLSVQDSLAGARGALQLATAAQIDNVTATKLVAGALNAFNLAGEDAVKVADLLTGAAKESQGEISDMGTALSQVAAVSQQFGVSIGDTVTLLTELAQAGLSGGRAGTSLRVAFLRLVNPTAEAAKALDNLNVAVRDANGNLRPGVFTDIKDALEGYTKAQQDATLATIFGSDAIRAAAIIGNKGVLAFLQTSAAINEVGLAQEQAAARTSGLQGSLENMKNQIEAVGLSFGNVAKGPVKLFVDGIAETFSNVNTTIDGATQLTIKIRDLGKSFADANPAFAETFKHFETFKKVVTLVNPVTRALVVASAATRKFGDDASDAAVKTDKWGNSIEGVGAPLSQLSSQLLQSAADSRIFTQQVTSDTQKMLQSAADSRIGVNGDRFTKEIPKVFNVERIQNIVQGFDAQEIRNRIEDDNKQLVADLQAEQAFLLKQLQSEGVKNRPALKRALEQSLLGVVSDIRQVQAAAAAEQDRLKREQEQRTREAIAEAKRQAELVQQQLRAQEQLRNSQLDLLIQAAGLTKGTADDKKAINNKIKVLQSDIKALDKIKNLTLAQKQKVVDLKSAILSLREKLQGLSSADSGGGFTLNDLFKEVTSNFETFGSNIAGRSGVLSTQDARGQFSGNVLAQLGTSQLTEAQRQTMLLTSIDQKLSGNASPSQRKSLTWQREATIEGLRGAAMAASYGYGAG